MFKKILTYVDMNNADNANEHLKQAVEMAKVYNTRLNIMTCMPDFSMPIVAQFFPANFNNEEVQQEVLKKLKEYIKKEVDDEVKTKAIIVEGALRDAILDVADQIAADFIILPESCKGSMFCSLGATSAHVTRHAKCSVMVCRPS